MTGVLFGVDLSNHQAGIDLHQIRREGFEFAFCKVTQGVGYRSPDWPRQRDTARAAGLLLAGYHYIDTADARDQATVCAAHLGDRSIPVALDFEAGAGNLAQFRAVLAAFTAAGMHVALSYVPRWYWQQVGGGDLAGLPPLWSSRYPSTRATAAAAQYEAVTDAHWAGYGGGQVAVLQFSSNAHVAGQTVDANAFRGSRDQLAALLGTRPGGPPAAGPRDLRATVPHMTGQDIVALQRKLNHDYPAYSRLMVDGDFGPATQAVVREFQHRAGLTVDGVVGAATRTALHL